VLSEDRASADQVVTGFVPQLAPKVTAPTMMKAIVLECGDPEVRQPCDRLINGSV